MECYAVANLIILKKFPKLFVGNFPLLIRLCGLGLACEMEPVAEVTVIHPRRDLTTLRDAAYLG